MADAVITNTYAQVNGGKLVLVTGTPTSGQIASFTNAYTVQGIAAGSVGTVGVVVAAANESVTSSTTLQNDDELSFAVAANAIYQFDMLLFVLSGTSVTPDVKIGFTMPTGSTMSWGVHGYTTGTSLSTGLYTGAPLLDGTPTTAVAFGVISTANGNSTVWVQGIIRTSSTSGTVQLQWAQNTSDATATVRQKDSYIKYTRVS